MTAIIFLILRILVSISLYAFILVLFYYLWKENRRQGDWLSNRKIPTISLTITAMDAPDLIRYFESDEVTIGRDAKCDCQLNDENVSNHHARFKYHHTQWWLEDLGSKNGTLINNQAVITPVVVISGDEIFCGKYTLKITISGEIQNKPENKNYYNDNGGTDD
jgi:pSer/pThr/pTyr-binding forkhead associated (FHA) protein